MRPLDPRRLEDALSGATGSVDPTPALVDAWRQLHHAAQIASEVGKSWAPPQADDSHTNFEWRDGSLLGAAIPAPRRFRAALRVFDLDLRLVTADGSVLASYPLDGATAASGRVWVRAQAERLSGEGPRQRAVPAPDLPLHPVAGGAPFAVKEAAGFADLTRLLAAADAVLRRIGEDASGASPVRCWPHHLDLAILIQLEGAPSRTIGLGLAGPDTIEASGYWYVSPWSERPPAAAHWPAPPRGRWIERGGPLPLAALSLAELSGQGGAGARRAAVAAFLASAFEASRAALG
jgi:hypothetical protein